jgi:hypothetical protein
MRPLTSASAVGDVFSGEIEVVVWLDFGGPENLTRAARRLASVYAGETPTIPDAEPGRHLYATIWPVDEQELDDLPPDLRVGGYDGAEHIAALWTNAYMLGIVRAATLLAICGEEKIGGRVYAVRVQQVGAAFPSTYQFGSENQGRVLG